MNLKAGFAPSFERASTGLIRWLTGLSLAVAIGMLGLGCAILFDLRADAWQRAEQASDNLILALSRDIARNITLYDLSMKGTINALANPALAQTDPIIRHMALFDSAASAEYLGAMLVVDAHGDMTANSIAVNPKPMNFAFREHFQVHQQRPDVGLYISRAFKGRLVPDPMIALTRRVSNPDGSFGGIVLGSLRTAYFKDRFDKLEIGAKGSVALFRNDGHVIMRRPFRPADIDQDLGATPTFLAYLQAPHGHLLGTSTLDGEQRLYTFHHVDNYPLILSVAIAVDDIYAQWWHKAIGIGAILAVLCISSIVLCLLFRREIMRRVAAEDALQQAAERLSVMAATDGLTGIANRRSFEASLTQEWRRAVRNETPMAVLMLDVDRFKLFNDTYGHPAGDAALKAVASGIVRQIRRPADFVARYGGEEFIALLPETEIEGALLVAESIRRAVADLMITHQHSPNGHLTISIGVAVSRPGLDDPEEALVKLADDALYEAKRAGRDRVAAAASAPPPVLTGPVHRVTAAHYSIASVTENAWAFLSRTISSP